MAGAALGVTATHEAPKLVSMDAFEASNCESFESSKTLKLRGTYKHLLVQKPVGEVECNSSYVGNTTNSKVLNIL